MLLDLLGLAVEDDYYPPFRKLVGWYRHLAGLHHTLGKDLSCWGIFVAQGGKFKDYMTLPGKLDRGHRGSAVRIMRPWQTSQR